MYFFLKYLVTLFYKKPRIKIVVSFLCESGPWPSVFGGEASKLVRRGGREWNSWES